MTLSGRSGFFFPRGDKHTDRQTDGRWVLIWCEYDHVTVETPPVSIITSWRYKLRHGWCDLINIWWTFMFLTSWRQLLLLQSFYRRRKCQEEDINMEHLKPCSHTIQSASLSAFVFVRIIYINLNIKGSPNKILHKSQCVWDLGPFEFVKFLKCEVARYWLHLCAFWGPYNNNSEVKDRSLKMHRCSYLLTRAFAVSM